MKGIFSLLPQTPWRGAVIGFVSAMSVIADGWAGETDTGFINDYPTVARADYIFGCMAANGQDRLTLERCACSIDVVAEIMSYDAYVEAEAVLRITRLGGEKTSVFRTSPAIQEMVHKLRRAQLEGELRCF